MNHTPRRPRAVAFVLACGFISMAAVTTAVASTEPPSSTEQATTEPTTTAPTTTTSRPTTTAAPTTAPPTTAEAVLYPLSGVPVEDPATYAPRPAMVVKVDNVDAEPQSGLNQADIVYEEIVEGRATRFAAVFNSMESNPVGPIRSGRTQDINLLANLNDPVFVWSGGNTGVTNALQSTGWTLLGQGTPGFFRDGSRPAPHNLYANMSDLWPQAGDSGDAVPIFEYGAQEGGTPVTFAEMMVGGYSVRWDWDATAGLFLRSQRGSPHELTDGQASTNNVVVLVVPYGTSPFGGPESQTVGTGAAVVYSNGSKFEGTWTRQSPEDPWTLEANGQPILLAPGRTWVELVDSDNNLGDG
jgi:Protein of unknown function (DUF3048) N-terminal domain/Protein of unknown function (DUF3048) C-terminal domain